MIEEARRDQQIALFTIPLLSALLSPVASLHLDLSWVRTNALFPTERLDFESQYWASLSAVLTRLALGVEWGKMTEDIPGQRNPAELLWNAQRNPEAAQ
ncbi:g11076 [Coccomyxa viridis]|uniref:G11076 protein n=1 Tax=Coccomyxa viridis TaxID=1274662 RepID=A0ABP1G9S4_9CHLO